MKKFSESLREHVMKTINFKKKKWSYSQKKQQESYGNAKICYICKEKYENKYVKDEKYRKVRDLCRDTGEFRSTAYNICNLKYSAP